MALEGLRQSSLYQNYLQSLVWAPINAHRRYRESKTRRFFALLAEQDTAQLNRVRADKERLYVNEQVPLVSITTPTYNRTCILVHKTLPSVISQSYHNFEWLIMRDHCTDHTGDLLAKIKGPRIRFHNLPTRPRYPRNKKKRWKIVGFKENTLAHEMAKGS